jgi:hypothetical protein
VLLDVLVALRLKAAFDYERAQIDQREQGEYNEPEPQDDVDFLREYVD